MAWLMACMSQVPVPAQGVESGLKWAEVPGLSWHCLSSGDWGDGTGALCSPTTLCFPLGAGDARQPSVDLYGPGCHLTPLGLAFLLVYQNQEDAEMLHPQDLGKDV